MQHLAASPRTVGGEDTRSIRAMFSSVSVTARRLGLLGWRKFAADARAATKGKKTIQQLATEIDLRDKPVLVRVDLNLPRSKEDGTITDDTRARAVRLLFLMTANSTQVMGSFLFALQFSCNCRTTIMSFARTYGY